MPQKLGQTQPDNLAYFKQDVSVECASLVARTIGLDFDQSSAKAPHSKEAPERVCDLCAFLWQYLD